MLLRAAQGYGMTKTWRPLDEISPNLVRAVIAGEDARFCQHHGFDREAIEAAWERYRRGGGRLVGASTISMQTAKNVFLWPGRDWLRKGLEAWFTVWIELFWSKRRIVEVYLNVVELGPGIYGAEAAARALFRQACRFADRNGSGAPCCRSARSARPLGESPRPGGAATRGLHPEGDAARAARQSAALRRALNGFRAGNAQSTVERSKTAG